jgi:hypothetical protein
MRPEEIASVGVALIGAATRKPLLPNDGCQAQTSADVRDTPGGQDRLPRNVLGSSAYSSGKATCVPSLATPTNLTMKSGGGQELRVPFSHGTSLPISQPHIVEAQYGVNMLVPAESATGLAPESVEPPKARLSIMVSAAIDQQVRDLSRVRRVTISALFEDAMIAYLSQNV